MITINKALEKIINDSPFLEDGLYNEYINLSSLAIYIKPKIDILTKKEVTIGAIKMALSRYIKSKQKIIKYKIFTVNDFFIKKNIKIVYIEKNHQTIQFLQSINKLGIFKGEDYFSAIQGGKSITLIYSEDLDNLFSPIIPKEHIEESISGLSLIGVYLEQNKLNESGIIYNLTKKINFSNINILEILSCYNEIHFIVKNDDLKNTLDAILV